MPIVDLFTNLSMTGIVLRSVVLSERLLNNVKRCEIRSEIYGASDHCPVMLEISDVI